jgi:hypothetical protein
MNQKIELITAGLWKGIDAVSRFPPLFRYSILVSCTLYAITSFMLIPKSDNILQMLILGLQAIVYSQFSYWFLIVLIERKQRISKLRKDKEFEQKLDQRIHKVIDSEIHNLFTKEDKENLSMKITDAVLKAIKPEYPSTDRMELDAMWKKMHDVEELVKKDHNSTKLNSDFLFSCEKCGEPFISTQPDPQYIIGTTKKPSLFSKCQKRNRECRKCKHLNAVYWLKASIKDLWI